jgi:hypothetical protein
MHIDTERAPEGDYRGSPAPSALHFTVRVPHWAFNNGAAYERPASVLFVIGVVS